MYALSSPPPLYRPPHYIDPAQEQAEAAAALKKAQQRGDAAERCLKQAI